MNHNNQRTKFGSDSLLFSARLTVFSVVTAGSGTTVYDTYSDYVEEDHTPQLDYKSVYGKTNSA